MNENYERSVPINFHSLPTNHFLNSGERSLLTMASSSVGGLSLSLTRDLE